MTGFFYLIIACRASAVVDESFLTVVFCFWSFAIFAW